MCAGKRCRAKPSQGIDAGGNDGSSLAFATRVQSSRLSEDHEHCRQSDRRDNMLVSRTRARVIALLVGLTVDSNSVLAGQVRSDTEIAQDLLGDWTNTKDSPELRGHIISNLIVETFEPGGKGHSAVYADETCHKAIRTHSFTWHVFGGDLIIEHDDGTTTTDHIWNMTKRSWTIASVQDRVVGYRVRTSKCQLPKTS